MFNLYIYIYIKWGGGNKEWTQRTTRQYISSFCFLLVFGQVCWSADIYLKTSSNIYNEKTHRVAVLSETVHLVSLDVGKARYTAGIVEIWLAIYPEKKWWF